MLGQGTVRLRLVESIAGVLLSVVVAFEVFIDDAKISELIAEELAFVSSSEVSTCFLER